MARAVSSIPDGPVALIGYALAALTALGAWARDKRKGDVDQSALVLGAWKDLVGNHQTQIGTLVAEVNSLRERLIAAEARIASLEDENRALRKEKDGLERQVAQRSQSAVTVLAPNTGVNAPTARKRFGFSEDEGGSA